MPGGLPPAPALDEPSPSPPLGAARHRVVVTCEDGIRDGGIGMAIEDAIGHIDPAVPIEVLGLPTRFVPHDGRPDRILAQLGLDADGIQAAARRFL